MKREKERTGKTFLHYMYPMNLAILICYKKYIQENDIDEHTYDLDIPSFIENNSTFLQGFCNNIDCIINSLDKQKPWKMFIELRYVYKINLSEIAIMLNKCRSTLSFKEKQLIKELLKKERLDMVYTKHPLLKNCDSNHSCYNDDGILIKNSNKINYLDNDISTFDISTRVINVVFNINSNNKQKHTLRNFLKILVNIEDITKIRNLGKKSIEEILKNPYIIKHIDKESFCNHAQTYIKYYTERYVKVDDEILNNYQMIRNDLYENDKLFKSKYYTFKH